ncbi:MAG: prepilin-type N-terminal cleavage/methylation domain-containing protein [Deltaproteobacteria bacterium]|nr:prepilin-type N-terminal cleavage/methylation domain-containing protein [Deltaproteobacteria bacterium]
MTRKLRNSGFTLLEILICMALIAIAFLAVSRLSAQNLDLKAEAQFLTMANYLAQERLSRIQARGVLEPDFMSGDFGEDFPYFSYQEEIEEISDREGVFKAKVKISLEERTGTKDLLIETYLYRKKI